MMADIVDYLKALEDDFIRFGDFRGARNVLICRGEIERLRAALREIADKTVIRTPHTYEDDLGDRLESIYVVTKEALGDE